MFKTARKLGSRTAFASLVAGGLISCHVPSDQELAMRRQDTTTGSRLPGAQPDAPLANNPMSSPGVLVSTFQPREGGGR